MGSQLVAFRSPLETAPVVGAASAEVKKDPCLLDWIKLKMAVGQTIFVLPKIT